MVTPYLRCGFRDISACARNVKKAVSQVRLAAALRANALLQASLPSCVQPSVAAMVSPRTGRPEQLDAAVVVNKKKDARSPGRPAQCGQRASSGGARRARGASAVGRGVHQRNVRARTRALPNWPSVQTGWRDSRAGGVGHGGSAAGWRGEAHSSKQNTKKCPPLVKRASFRPPAHVDGHLFARRTGARYDGAREPRAGRPECVCTILTLPSIRRVAVGQRALLQRDGAKTCAGLLAVVVRGCPVDAVRGRDGRGEAR